jgi:hypothetical protein
MKAPTDSRCSALTIDGRPVGEYLPTKIEKAEKIVLAFSDLREMGLVKHWSGLRRLIECEGFPAGFWLSQNSRRWFLDDVMAFLRSRPAHTEPKPAGGAAKLRAQGVKVSNKKKARG